MIKGTRTPLYLLICLLNSAIAAGSGGGAAGDIVACTAGLASGASSSDEISMISTIEGRKRECGFSFFLLGGFFFGIVDSASEDERATTSSVEC